MSVLVRKKDSVLSRGKSPDEKAAISTSNFVVFISFILFFVYGFVLLMSSYTGGAVIKVVGTHALRNNGVFAVVPQAVGLVLGVIFLKFITKSFSLRTIMIVGWTIATIFLCLNASIDKIFHSSLFLKNGKPDYVAGTAMFIIFNVMFGLGISGVSPGIGIFFSRRFVGKNRIVMLGACQGLFGVGAGIIPLAAAAMLYKQTSNATSNSIDSVRYFFIVACVLAGVCICLSFFMKVAKASKDELKIKLTKKEMVTQKKKNLSPINFRVILMSAIICYILYMFCETIGSYNIQRFVNDNNNPFTSDHETNRRIQVLAIRCAGLLSFTEGVTRTLASIFICPRVRLRHYLTFSLLLLIGAYVFAMTGVASTHLLDNKNHINPAPAYLLALLFGVGIGNIWPTLNCFLNEIDNKRAALISIHINRTTSIMILVSQSAAAGILNYSGYFKSQSEHAHKFTLIMAAAITSCCALIVFIWTLTYWLKKQRIVHPDEYKAVFYKKATSPNWAT